MSLKENSLGDSGVFNSFFNDVECVVVQIVVDDALSDSVVFIGVLDNWLLEVTVEVQDLYLFQNKYEEYNQLKIPVDRI